MSIMGRLEVGSCLVITLEGGSWSRHSLEHWPLRVLFLSGGQGLLPAVSWCSVRSSASEDVSLMNPRREKYPTSTDSSVSCYLPSSLVISVQFNDFFFLISLHSCADITVIQLWNISSIPPQSPSDHFRCFVSCIFSCQPFKFLFQSCSVESLVDSKRGKYLRKLGESMTVQYLIWELLCYNFKVVKRIYFYKKPTQKSVKWNVTVFHL